MVRKPARRSTRHALAGILALAAAATVAGCGGNSALQTCGVDSCRIKVETKSDYDFTIFDDVPVNVSRITEETVDVRIAGDTVTAREGQETRSGAYRVVVESTTAGKARLTISR